jgi:hypothetical protein
MPKKDAGSGVLHFQAALATGRCFVLDHEGEARLTLQVPSAFAHVLAEAMPQLRDRTFAVGISLAPID